MRNGATAEKSPREDYEYTFRWKGRLDKISDTISSYTNTVDSGITIGTQSNDTNSVTVWLSGGTDGCTYKITNQIVTTGGRTLEGYFYVKVVDPDSDKRVTYNG